MSVFAETVEQYEARFEAFLAANLLDDAAIMAAMPPADTPTPEALAVNIELPY